MRESLAVIYTKFQPLEWDGNGVEKLMNAVSVKVMPYTEYTQCVNILQR